MKKIVLFICCFLLATLMHAGELLRGRGAKTTFTFDISPKAAFGNSIFLNSNVDTDPNANRYFFCPSYFYGGRAGITFMSSKPRYVMFTIYGEYLFSSITQNYQLKDYTSPTSPNYKHGYSFGAHDLAFVFRMTFFSGEDHTSAMYLEVGKQTTTLNKFSETNSITSPDFNTGLATYNPSSRFNSSLSNVIFGIGAHGSMYSIGLRCTYGLNSLMASNYNPVEDGHYSNQALNTDYTKYYSSYKQTNLLMIQLVFELNLYVLELGNATCGKKRFFPFPFHLNNIIVW